MTKYESGIKQIAAPVELVYQKLSNLENLRPLLEAPRQLQGEELERLNVSEAQIEEVREKLKDVRLTQDTIAIPAPMVGEIALRIIEREENKTIKFETEQSPILANMWIQVLPPNDYESRGTKMRLTLKADLNPMVKMMIGKKLEEGIDKFADLLAAALARAAC